MTEGIVCTPRLNSSRCLGLGSGFALAIIWNFGRPNRSVLKTIFKIWEFEGERRFGLDVWLCLERVVSLSVVCVSQSTSLTHDYEKQKQRRRVQNDKLTQSYSKLNFVEDSTSALSTNHLVCSLVNRPPHFPRTDGLETKSVTTEKETKQIM